MVRPHVVLLLLSPAVLMAQGMPEVVRGRVMAVAGAAIRGAEVTVTKTTDGTAQTTKSDSLGAYRVDWPNGSSSYLIQIAAPGFQPLRKIVARSGPDSIIVFDATLQPAAVAQL